MGLSTMLGNDRGRHNRRVPKDRDKGISEYVGQKQEKARRKKQLTVLPFPALLTSQLVCESTMLPETSMTDFPFNNREEEGESVSPPAQLSEMCTMMLPTCL